MGYRSQWVVAIATIVAVLAVTEVARRHGPYPVAVSLVVPWIYVGVVSVVAGVLVGRWRPGTRLAWLLIAAGWLSLARLLQYSNHALGFTSGGVLSGLDLTVLVHVVLALPSGRVATTVDRALVAAVYAVAVGASVVPNLFFECGGAYFTGCPGNLLLVRDDPALVDAGERAFDIAGVVILAAVGARLLRRWWRASPPLRRVLGPPIAAGAALWLTLLVGVVGLWDRHGDMAVITEPLVMSLLPAGVLVGVLGSKARAGDLGAFVTAVQPSASDRAELATLLATASGDRSIELLDVADALATTPPSGRLRTPVESGGLTLAIVEHDEALRAEPELLAALVATLRLALDNAALAGRVQRQLGEVQASRARLLAAQQDERRRIERDLHDGAQQHLVTARLLLAMALERGGDADLVVSAAGEIDVATNELRVLAHGLHPSLVSERGLTAAVESLAERAAVPVDVVGSVERLAPLVETVAYFVVAESLTNVAKHAAAEGATVSLWIDDMTLVVEIADDGCGGADLTKGTGIVGLRDRVEAAGGDLRITTAPDEGTTVAVRLPIGVELSQSAADESREATL